MLDRARTIYRRLYPYYKMLRVNEQCAILVAFFFGALDAHYFNLRNLFIIAFGLFCLSVSSFIVNEYVDAKDTDKYAAKIKGHFQTKTVKQVVLILWFLFGSVGSAILFAYGLYWQALATLALGVVYSLPPIRLKARFAYDMLCIFVYLILIPYTIGFSLTGTSFDQVFRIPFISMSLFLGTAEGIHLLGDLEADRLGGLHNTPVVLGYQNLIKIVTIMTFFASAGFIYLVYEHGHWWYYPLIFFAALAILSLGYARGNLYNKDKLIARFSWATKKAVSLGNYLFVYQIVLIWLLSRDLIR